MLVACIHRVRLLFRSHRTLRLPKACNDFCNFIEECNECMDHHRNDDSIWMLYGLFGKLSFVARAALLACLGGLTFLVRVCP